MRKILVFFIVVFSFNSCSRLPKQEEVEYRGRLENALIDTFPKKMTVVIHPFENLSPHDTNRAYLERAIPDNIEAMLESLRSTLAYVPFDGMPFYVSSELSNLFQTVSTEDEETSIEITTNNGLIITNEIFLNEVVTNEFGNIITNNSTTSTNEVDTYFSYLSNYLLVVPTQETQYNVLTTTNSDYYEYTTNVIYENAIAVTNVVTNRILHTTTNGFETNLLVVNKNILTPTNMLLLLYEEFPELTNYLSFLPISVRRATESDTVQYLDYKLRMTNPREWQRQQAQKEKEAKENQESMVDIPSGEVSPYPKDEFEYVYHVGGDFQTRQGENAFVSADASIRMHILPMYSSGHEWWQQTHNQSPPLLSDILYLESTLDPEDMESYKTLFLRTPVSKPDVSPRLQDEFDTYSTNFRDSRPETPEKPIAQRDKTFNLMLDVKEHEIPTAMMEWSKYFHALIVNRPYTALIVNTDQTNTLVYLNGLFIGKTPLVYSTAPIGEQRIAFIKEGFNREEILTEILPNQTNRILHSLKALDNTGVIRVTSSMPDAEVYVNALYKGKAPIIISNLTLDEKYRVEVLNPRADLSSNRNSVYRNVQLTQNKPSVDIDAHFKDFESMYRTPAQKGLLAATYITWFTAVGLIGGSVYTQYRYNEAVDMLYHFGTPTTEAEIAQYAKYLQDKSYYDVASRATLYSAIGMSMLATGIMGWYLYSKDVYLGLDLDPEKNEWYAKFKLEF